MRLKSRETSYLSFLDDLLEEEVAQKEQCRVETTLKFSGLPFIKSIDEFDFTFQPGLDRQKVMSLFDLTFIRLREGQHHPDLQQGIHGLGRALS